MMNESHAGTEKAKGWKKQIKRMLVRRFDAALVGGKPHKEHFSAFGIPPDKIFTGYDAISNRTFSSGATEAKENAKNRRAELKLPPRYFLSLGRMVRKKNLQTLVSAYALFCQSTEAPVALCFVGSGETESALQSQAQSLGLRVHEGESLDEQTRLELGSGDVCFYGFRQISENPFFYGLAEAFILPSTKEEWGLVVNEAMASGLPVLVANGVGCAMDLVDHEVNGYLFNPMDAETLSGFLVDIATNTEKRAAMGKASERIIADWDVDNFARNAIKAVNAARAEA
ncbi:MAG: glycosyltransferase family 4 protein [Verrucomicrobiota bacterium]